MMQMQIMAIVDSCWERDEGQLSYNPVSEVTIYPS